MVEIFALLSAIQKQPFTVILLNRGFSKFHKFTEKHLKNWWPATLFKRALVQVFSCDCFLQYDCIFYIFIFPSLYSWRAKVNYLIKIVKMEQELASFYCPSQEMRSVDS